MEHVLSVRLHEVGRLAAALHEPDAVRVALGEAVFVEVAVPTDDIEHYAGEYDVTPQATAQVLATRDKLMDDNVRVKPVPYRETPLPGGGIEVTIGGQ